MPLQMRIGRNESPIIGGLAHQTKLDTNQFAAADPMFKKTSPLDQKIAVAVSRPNINKPVVESVVSKKRAAGFGGFKAPPATDLIDELLLEQDQNSIR